MVPHLTRTAHGLIGRPSKVNLVALRLTLAMLSAFQMIGTGTLTTPGGLFWAYICSRLASHVTIHYAREPEVTTFQVYGNAWGCLRVLKVIHEALPIGIASLVFGLYGGIAPTLPMLPEGKCGMCGWNQWILLVCRPS